MIINSNALFVLITSLFAFYYFNSNSFASSHQLIKFNKLYQSSFFIFCSRTKDKTWIIIFRQIVFSHVVKYLCVENILKQNFSIFVVLTKFDTYLIENYYIFFFDEINMFDVYLKCSQIWIDEQRLKCWIFRSKFLIKRRHIFRIVINSFMRRVITFFFILRFNCCFNKNVEMSSIFDNSNSFWNFFKCDVFNICCIVVNVVCNSKLFCIDEQRNDHKASHIKIRVWFRINDIFSNWIVVVHCDNLFAQTHSLASCYLINMLVFSYAKSC